MPGQQLPHTALWGCKWPSTATKCAWHARRDLEHSKRAELTPDTRHPIAHSCATHLVYTPRESNACRTAGQSFPWQAHPPQEAPAAASPDHPAQEQTEQKGPLVSHFTLGASQFLTRCPAENIPAAARSRCCRHIRAEGKKHGEVLHHTPQSPIMSPYYACTN